MNGVFAESRTKLFFLMTDSTARNYLKQSTIEQTYNSLPSAFSLTGNLMGNFSLICLVKQACYVFEYLVRSHWLKAIANAKYL